MSGSGPRFSACILPLTDLSPSVKSCCNDREQAVLIIEIVACQASTVFVSGLLYTLTVAVASNSAATRAGGVVCTGTWASQSTTVSFDWCVVPCVRTDAGFPDVLLFTMIIT